MVFILRQPASLPPVLCVFEALSPPLLMRAVSAYTKPKRYNVFELETRYDYELIYCTREEKTPVVISFMSKRHIHSQPDG